MKTRVYATPAVKGLNGMIALLLYQGEMKGIMTHCSATPVYIRFQADFNPLTAGAEYIQFSCG